MAATPRRRSSALSARIRFSAPRSLKLAVNCRFSNLSQTSQPAMPDKVRECRVGVRTSAGVIAACAALMSEKLGAMILSPCMGILQIALPFTGHLLRILDTCIDPETCERISAPVLRWFTIEFYRDACRSISVQER